MRKKIYLYELECYKKATDEQRNIKTNAGTRYFDLRNLPSESIRSLLEEFIWERGSRLKLSSMASEILYHNNIRDFVIDQRIRELRYKDEERIIRKLKGWMLEKGYALSSERYKPEYDRISYETPNMVKHLKKILLFSKEEDNRDEWEKDIWDLSKFEFTIRSNPINNKETINFTAIAQEDIREEVKKAIYLHLKYEALSTVLSELTATRRFARFLKERFPNIKSLKKLERNLIEQYLIYLKTEATSRKSFRSDLYALRRVIEDVGKIYEVKGMDALFLNNDFPSTPKYLFKFYSDAEIKRLNEHIIKMDEQICRAFIIHQLLGGRISETLTLKTDCLSIRENNYFIRIDSIKSMSYEKAISDELAQLIEKAVQYTKERYGETEYIFVKKDDPTKPYQYGMLRQRIKTLICQNDIRDDHGELMKFGTHIFRHCYGKKLTELHVDDWMIARLLGHKTLRSVHYYRKIGNKMMADETRKTREKMDMILLDVIKGWDGYEI